jgi:hypothetical protein
MLVLIMHAPCVQSRDFTPWSLMPRRCGQIEANARNSDLALQGPFSTTEGHQNHDNDTGDVARGQCWPTSCTHRVCKAEFSLLGPICRVGAAKPRQNTRNPDLMGSPGAIWYCCMPPNHDNDTGNVARGQCWSSSCTHRMCTAKLSLLGP